MAAEYIIQRNTPPCVLADPEITILTITLVQIGQRYVIGGNVIMSLNEMKGLGVIADNHLDLH